ncbi:GRF zinc finger domain-containing protein [Sarocladium implicatum]|nr:GRF zinc finger domain-containing protein [Sarocladium implicatum]
MAAVPRSTQPQPLPDDTPATSFKRLYGCYQDGKWWCNCQPNRRPAVLREVTKDTPNKGKFFWACPIFAGCNFFLFRDDARVRETGLKTTNPTEEHDLPPRPKTPTQTQQKLTAFGVQVTPGKRRQSQGEEDSDHYQDAQEEQPQRKSPRAAESSTMVRRAYPSSQEMAQALRTPESAKRQKHTKPAPAIGDDDSTDEFSDLADDSDDERQLMALADASAKKATASASVVTPQTGTRNIEGLPTPSSISRNLFPSDRPRRKSVTFEPVTPSRFDGDDEEVFTDSNPSATITNSSTSTTTLSPNSPSSSSDPSTEILSLLTSQKLDQAALTSVRNLLTISSRRARGVEKSRDVLRDQLHRQKLRNAKLQDKISALEDKLKVRNRNMTDLKAGLRELYEEN